MFDDLLFIPSLDHTTAELFNSLIKLLTSHDMDWLKNVGISTGRAYAMSGMLTGFIERIKESIPSVTWYHCCRHGKALLAKDITRKTKTVFNEAVKMVNYIKSK